MGSRIGEIVRDWTGEERRESLLEGGRRREGRKREWRKKRWVYLQDGYTAIVPREKRAMRCVGRSVSIKTERRSVRGTKTLAISAANTPPLRTRLPIAPAALALVFSSASLSDADARRGIEQCREGYSSSQWKAALPTAKHANFRVLASTSAQQVVKRVRGEQGKEMGFIAELRGVMQSADETKVERME
jgi:hypothetical protein